jgi:Fic family protein
MDPKHFRNRETGTPIRTPEGYWAFLPAPLPPALRYDQDLVLLLSRADAALSELSGLGRQLPNPRLLIEPYVRREALLSSRIEGTRASLSDLLLDEAGEEAKETVRSDVREVRNYMTALEYGVARIKSLPLSLRLVRELHARLLKGVRGERGTPGEFRRSQNWIGPKGSTPGDAPYVPPPPGPMMEALGKWEKFLHRRDEIPDLIQCAMIHEQFEAIHPFLDGNGRVGRLLITLFLVERGRLSQPLLYLSAFIEAHRQDYYDVLQRTRTEGDWKGWIRFFLTGVRETAHEGVSQAKRLLALRDRLKEELAGKPKAQVLLDHLFTNPYITASRARSILRVSDPTARKAMKALEDKGILKEISGREWGRIYLAAPVLKVIAGKG